MAKTNGRLGENAILGRLKGKLLDEAGGELVSLKLRQTIYEPEETIDSVYFRLSSVISIGREGMTGIPLLMGSDTTANESFC